MKELAEEVGRTVSTGEYHDIVGDRILRTRRIDPARPRASAALVNAQHELAFCKRRVRDEGKDPARAAGSGAGIWQSPYLLVVNCPA